MHNILMNWRLANNFGWGILGLNIFSRWANDPDIRPIMGGSIVDADLEMTDPLRLQAIRKALQASNSFLSTITVDSNKTGRAKASVIDALGNDFSISNLYGERNIGRCIFENTAAPLNKDLSKYDALLTASAWNARILQETTGRKAFVIFEGVDTSLFCPGPKSGLLPKDKFYIFTGGKIEFRKGQDLVLMAFRKFASSHPDAILVTAWHSPWPKWAAGFRGRLKSPLSLDGDGRLNILRWVKENGINPCQVIDLGPMRAPQMPLVLRDMDVALQPSRAEACTNLPVKEAMACGIPVIAALNTGMRDLLTSHNSIPLHRQKLVKDAEKGVGTEDWGESDIDEIVEALNFCYEKRNEAQLLGCKARQWLIDNKRTWQDHAEELKRWVLSLR